jgi:hypothetical protein
MATATKKRMPEMLPVKKWLSTKEACSYLDCGPTFLAELPLTVSAIGKKYYYSVASIDRLLEASIL